MDLLFGVIAIIGGLVISSAVYIGGGWLMNRYDWSNKSNDKH